MYRKETNGTVISSADNPVTRSVALEGAAVVTKNGWRAWIAHHRSGKVLFQNPAEIAHLRTVENKLASPPEPMPRYWHDKAVEQLSRQSGLRPMVDSTNCEKLLWNRLVELQSAAYAVLSDVDDDGVAEANDMAIRGLRDAVKGKGPLPMAKRRLRAVARTEAVSSAAGAGGSRRIDAL